MKPGLTATIFIASLLIATPGEAKPCPFPKAQLRDDFRYYQQEIAQKKEGDLELLLHEFQSRLSNCGWTPESLGIASTELSKAFEQNLLNVVEKGKAEIRAMKSSREFSLSTFESFLRSKNLLTKENIEFLRAERARLEKLDTSRKRFLDHCEFQDLSQRIPARDGQDSVGWCYAFVAADLLSFYTKKNVSPFDLALGYNSEEYKRDLSPNKAHQDIYGREGGLPGKAFNQAVKSGACLEKDMPSDPKVFVQLKQDFYQLEKLLALHQKSNPQELCQEYQANILRIFPSLSFEDFARSLKESTERNIAENLIANSCKKREKISERLLASDIGAKPGDGSIDRIRERLHQEEPSGITVNLKSWLRPGAAEAYGNSGITEHAMVVVGQSKNTETGKCELILKNSWGTECAAFEESKVKCDPFTGNLRVSLDRIDASISGYTVVNQ